MDKVEVSKCCGGLIREVEEASTGRDCMYRGKCNVCEAYCDAIDKEEFMDNKGRIEDRIRSQLDRGAAEIDPYGISGGKRLLVFSAGPETSHVPYPISLEFIDRSSSSQVVCMSSEGARQLIKALLDFI